MPWMVYTGVGVEGVYQIGGQGVYIKIEGEESTQSGGGGPRDAPFRIL
jgi:hypothetical protein